MDKKIAVEIPGTADVAVKTKVDFLCNPASWPFPVKQVEVKETHMSWVFLVNGYVFKLKKPVRNRLFDFSGIDARFKNCTEELRLNKRLAGDIYLEMVPLYVDEAGSPSLIRNGRLCDWMVKMKRIPEEDMMDYAIRHQILDQSKVLPVAGLLTRFYLGLEGIALGTEQYLTVLKDEILEISSALENPVYSFPLAEVRRIRDLLTEFINKNTALLESRVKNGFVREVHGDLRPEHICIGPSPAVIDCLEFSRSLRIMDVVQELAYLDMECEMMGENTAGKIILNTWITGASDPVSMELTGFYRLRKAFLRAWLVARHIEEQEYTNDPEWLIKAGAYLKYGRKFL